MISKIASIVDTRVSAALMVDMIFTLLLGSPGWMMRTAMMPTMAARTVVAM